MCIIFTYIGNKNSKYKAIIASNRDEFLIRPTKAACRWPQDSSVIGGIDLQNGKEGGTWLGICGKRRKLAALLNYPIKDVGNLKGRGFIVTDFLVSDATSEEYIENIHKTHHEYNPFNFVSLEFGIDNTNKMYHYSGLTDTLKTFETGCHSFSNCTLDRPLQKSVKGREKFENIISKCGDDKDQLIKELLCLLKWDVLHLPDQVIDDFDFIKSTKIASVFVSLAPDNKYGTRTHTIILVDAEDKIEYFEWTRVTDESMWAETHIFDKLG